MCYDSTCTHTHNYWTEVYTIIIEWIISACAYRNCAMSHVNLGVAEFKGGGNVPLPIIIAACCMYPTCRIMRHAFVANRPWLNVRVEPVVWQQLIQQQYPALIKPEWQRKPAGSLETLPLDVSSNPSSLYWPRQAWLLYVYMLFTFTQSILVSYCVHLVTFGKVYTVTASWYNL